MTDTKNSGGILLLAAGFSRRFGGIKLKAQLPNGNTIFQQTLKNIQQATDNIVVVGRKQLLEAGVYQGFPYTSDQILSLCEDAEAGMGQSLSWGIQQVPAHWRSVLICLGDMPFVQARTLTTLMQNSAPDRILIPTYNGQRGHPISFGCRYFEELAQSQGDTGGRHVIRDHAEQVVELEVDDEGILLDIDTPQTLAALGGRS